MSFYETSVAHSLGWEFGTGRGFSNCLSSDSLPPETFKLQCRCPAEGRWLFLGISVQFLPLPSRNHRGIIATIVHYKPISSPIEATISTNNAMNVAHKGHSCYLGVS